MAPEGEKGAAQAPPPPPKTKVHAEQCTVQGPAEIRVYASSSCATVAAWTLVAVTALLGFFACRAANYTWEQVQETKDMRFADNLPAFLVQPLPKRDKPVLGVRLTNMGKGPAVMQAVGFMLDNTYYRLELDQLHKYFVPLKAHIDYPHLSFDAMAKGYAKHTSIAGVDNFLALGHHLRSRLKEPSEQSFTIDCCIEYADVCGRVHRQHYFFDIITFEKGENQYIYPGRYRLLSAGAEEVPAAPETVVELKEPIPSIPPPEGPTSESLQLKGGLSPASTISGSGPVSGEPVPYMPKEVPR